MKWDRESCRETFEDKCTQLLGRISQHGEEETQQQLKGRADQEMVLLKRGKVRASLHAERNSPKHRAKQCRLTEEGECGSVLEQMRVRGSGCRRSGGLALGVVVTARSTKVLHGNRSRSGLCEGRRSNTYRQDRRTSSQ